MVDNADVKMDARGGHHLNEMSRRRLRRRRNLVKHNQQKHCCGYTLSSYFVQKSTTSTDNTYMKCINTGGAHVMCPNVLVALIITPDNKPTESKPHFFLFMFS